MKAELKRRWVEALRSGKYKQVNSTLRSGHGYPGEERRYCCLGVLCDIVDPNGWTDWQSRNHPLADDGNSYIRTSALRELGLIGRENGGYSQRKLAKLNDEGGMDFIAIADIIDKHIKTED